MRTKREIDGEGSKKKTALTGEVAKAVAFFAFR
jgi:hypothetical protein